ncbi:hypothetical protein BCR44DRAFT_1455236 [Catenaria anguillulae PL171]|uniref:Uncharacterized protein n=1 Tax=Catenaria anguillulae PL171 TaxID=765915 RepID=A0A1Y2H200_9FUNG|nr:hypothetical protein BCR44DRAFT_1455236 [Catenaria anguillulae PL171]
MAKKIDFDDLFAYDTFKVVRVRDRRLGVPYYSFVVAIAAYILYSIISDQLYLRKEEVTNGSVRITIQPPATGIATPDYCARSPAGSCLYYDAFQVTPASTDNADGKTYYIADIENYTLMFEHTVRGQSDALASRSGDMVGVFKDPKGKPMRVFTPSWMPNSTVADVTKADLGGDSNRMTKRAPQVPGDVLPVKELLAAANISSLDLISESPSARPDEPIRESGLVLLVTIQYGNRAENSSALGYTYSATYIKGTEAKVLDSVYVGPSGGPTGVQARNRRGIRIAVVQTGKLGRFDFMALLTNLVASLALLRVAVLIIEFLLLWVMPEKEHYRHWKIQTTDDFSDIRDREESPRKIDGQMKPMGVEVDGRVEASSTNLV